MLVNKKTMEEAIILLEPKRFFDNRGYFTTTFHKLNFLENYASVEFVQENLSLSVESQTLRGLHFQAPPNAQAKLVRCSRGSIYDVVVDIRVGSPNYGQWKAFELSVENGYQLFIPVGFAHGFVTLKPHSEIVYKCSSFYSPSEEGSLLWCDVDINIEWPLESEPILSFKDSSAPTFNDFKSPFIYGVNS